jgi:putative membrane protein
LLLACCAAVAQPAPGGNPMQREPNAPWVQPGVDAPQRSGGELGRTDRNFMEKAARSGLAEVAAGRLAMQQARDPAVREFAGQLVKDHEGAHARLQQIAAVKRVTLPTTPDKGQQKALARLRKQRGDDFDKAFLDRMVRDHQKAIDLFGHEIKGRHQDGDLKDFAQHTVVGLERHLADAMRLRKARGTLPGA